MPITQYSPESGLYLVAESIDGGGKKVAISAIRDAYVEAGKGVVDLRLLWPSNYQGRIPPGKDNLLTMMYGNVDIIPKFEDLAEHMEFTEKKPLDAIICCEPTWASIGLAIRNKIIHKVQGKSYNARDTAQAYADDRQELIEKLIRPAILAGVDVFCERNYVSSLVYQTSMDETADLDHVLGIAGNRFAIQNCPHLYIICDISAETAGKRTAKRAEEESEDDECKFEVPEFQRKIADQYRADWLPNLLLGHGAMVVYLNTDDPTEIMHTQEAAVHIVEDFKKGELTHLDRWNFSLD